MTSENSDLRQQFAVTAALYRARSFRLLVFFALVLVFGFLVVLPSQSIGLNIFWLIALLTTSVISWRVIPRLSCPACQLSLRACAEIIQFCPECGSKDIQRKGGDNYFLIWPRCRACGQQLARQRRRPLYRIRFCTRCGAYLDDEGV